MVMSPRDSDPRMTALVRASSSCKRQTHLSSEKKLCKDYNLKGSVEKKGLVMSLKGLGGKMK
jgi:hypothetical protein